VTERFTLLSELGRGGMGVVWKARDEETGQIVALKLLHAAFALDADYVTRFERELELAKRIHSAHVVEVLGYGARDGTPYLALENVDGPSLRELLASHGPYEWPEARALLIQITQGLSDAHAAGVVHRDLKPSNVLIGPDGVAKLADFGIAKGLDLTRVTGTSTLLGTPAYLAPEGPLDERSDLYSLGIVAYELLSGTAPFTGSTYQEVIVRHIREAPDLSKLPPEARSVVNRLLAKSPAKRPQSASEVIGLLGRGAAPLEPVSTLAAGLAPALAPRFRPTSGSRRRPILAGLGAVVCAVVVASLAFSKGAVPGATGWTPSPVAAAPPSASTVASPPPSPLLSPTLPPTASMQVIETSAPAIVRIRPQNSEITYDPNQPVTVWFTLAMDEKSTAAAFSVTADGRAVTGSTHWTEGGTVLVLVPRYPFNVGTKIVATVSAAARSAGGVNLGSAATATFTVANPKASPIPYPSVSATATAPHHAAEVYFLSLMNCIRTGGWITTDGECSSMTHHTLPAQNSLTLDVGISNKIARPYAEELADNVSLDHYLGGTTPHSRLCGAGYCGGSWGENIASASTVDQAGMISIAIMFENEYWCRCAHYYNIMNGHFSSAGVGVWDSKSVRAVVDFYG
jgi:serine/threonine-protein kinase